MQARETISFGPSIAPSLIAWVAALLCGCGGAQPPRQEAEVSIQKPYMKPNAPPQVPQAPQVREAGSFDADLAFLREHTPVVVLGGAEADARVAVAPEYQGRVMTSTARGGKGTSFGFINREAVASGERAPHMNVFGGEDRFWLGPEGGQYALYFEKGSPFDLEHWQVPEPIDWGAWSIVAQKDAEVSLRREMALTNYAGTRFGLRVDRTVRLLDATALASHLGGAMPDGVAAVGYESVNTITNTGGEAWRKESGLLSIWILGMYRPAPTTTVVLPFRKGPQSELGPIVNDAYFGAVPKTRLKIGDGVLFFRGDGQERGKIGLPRPRATGIAGSYDSAASVLTLVQLTLPEDAHDYVNSMWEQQAKPYGGDVINSYNDGPPAPGEKPLGPFYELETSSPGAALAPGESLTHVHRTFHLEAAEGGREALDAIAKRQLGVGLAEIAAAL